MRYMCHLTLLIVVLTLQSQAANFVLALQSLGTSSIRHVIYFIQENHSFDNYFATFPAATGSTSWKDSGNNVHALSHLDPKLLYGDCPHKHADIMTVMCGAVPSSCTISPGGSWPMNGWNLVTYDGTHVCAPSGTATGGITANTTGINTGYYDGGDIPRYWRFAYNFGLADHFFSGVFPSLPGHKEIVGDIEEYADQPTNATGPDNQYSQWSCDHTYGQGGTTTNGIWGSCSGGTIPSSVCKQNSDCSGGGTCAFPSTHPFIYDTTNEALYPAATNGGEFYSIALSGSSTGLSLGTGYIGGRCGANSVSNIGAACFCQTASFPATGSVCASSICGDTGSAKNCFVAAEIGGSPGALCSESPNQIFALMDTANVSWAVYAPTIGTLGYEWNIPAMFAYTRFGPDWTNNLRSLNNLASDIQNCSLPAVTFVTPTLSNSEHQPAAAQTGEEWVGGLIDILASNRACWNTTIAFITWDDHGGMEDHVTAACIGTSADPLHCGPRVPFLCVG
jgi:hypothetical protein